MVTKCPFESTNGFESMVLKNTIDDITKFMRSVIDVKSCGAKT